jgi:hypothetical protein
MRYSISINEVAEHDIREVYLDYNNKKEGLGDEFKSEIIAGIEYLKREAQTIQLRYGTIRIYFLKRFPFGIHFQIVESTVQIIAVYAMKDDPKKMGKIN